MWARVGIPVTVRALRFIGSSRSTGEFVNDIVNSLIIDYDELLDEVLGESNP